MMTEVLIDGITITVDGGEWQSDTPGAAAACKEAAQGLDPRPYYPDPDLAAAAYVAQILGGEIITVTPLPEMPPGTVF